MICYRLRSRLFLQAQKEVYLVFPTTTSLLQPRLRTFASIPIRRSSPNMSSLYDQSIPVMIKYLTNASKILEKTVAYADEKGMKHEDILTFRLRDDMRP